LGAANGFQCLLEPPVQNLATQQMFVCRKKEERKNVLMIMIPAEAYPVHMTGGAKTHP